MKKIKVLHFIHGLNTGGAETLLKNYMLNFDRDKFDMMLLCLSHELKYPYERILCDNGVKVIFADDYLFFKKRSDIFTKVINGGHRYLIVKKIIEIESPDILHTHLPINTYIKFAKPSNSTKIVHTVHSEPRVLWNSKRRRVWDYKATNWLIKHYNMRLIVLHERMQREVNEMFGVSDSIILNNGVDAEKIKNARNSNDIRAELGIPKNAFVIGHIGRFSAVKNQKFLVDVFAEIKKTKQEAYLLMIGDGPDMEEIVKKIDSLGLKNDCQILLSRDDVPDLLNAMDVFVFPSLYEGLPLSLIEAQIARKPCFISDTINEHAVISNLVSRLSLKQGAEEWAEAIVGYKKPTEIVVNDEEWDIKKITRKLERIYLNVLAERKNGKK